MNNRSVVFIMLVICLTLFGCVYAKNIEYTDSDTNFQLLIEDDANLLTDSELDKLMTDMMPLTKHGNIIFKSINYNSTSTQNYARDYYHGKYQTASGSVLLVDMANRIIYIFSDGNNYKVITSNKAEIITDNIYKYASYGEYYSCASEAFSQMNALLEGFKIAEPMRRISNLLVALVCGFFISFIFVMANAKQRKAKAKEILKNCNIDFKIISIVGQKVGEHRVYSPPSSSSSSGGGHSSGGGGHSSHSSHSSGGGGGHRF